MLTKQTNTQPPSLQRSNGVVRISFKRRGDDSVLDELFQQGSAKVKLGRKEKHRLTEAVSINTSGGMTGGDCFVTNVHWQKATTAIVTTQAAERCYKSISGSAEILSHLIIDENATGLWLPQETIMFDQADYHRTTIVDLKLGGQFLGLELSVFGRMAMGETITHGKVKECWTLSLQGKTIFKDAFALSGNINQKLSQPAIANGAKAIATIIYYGPLAQEICTIATQFLNDKTTTASATSFDDLTIIRILAKDGQKLRAMIIPLLEQFLNKVTNNKTNTPLLPRVWNM